MAGNIAKRPNGKWRARYRDDTGQEHSRHFDRKIDAQRWLDEITTSVQTGTYVSPKDGKVTFREYAEQWHAVQIHRESTSKHTRTLLERYAYPSFGDKPLSNIRPSQLQAWIKSLPLAPTTVETTCVWISTIFGAAVRDRLIFTNPMTGLRRPDTQREMFIPTLEQLETLKIKLPDRFSVVIDLAIGAGLRQAELFGLELDCVDFLRRTLTVRQQLVHSSPAYLGPVKTPKSNRVIPLAQATVDALAEHLTYYPATTREIDDRTNPHKPVRREAQLIFTTEKGGFVDRSAWSKLWRPAAAAAGIPDGIGLHCCRHWYASALIHHGESAKVVQERMGHASAVITWNTYTHLFPNSDERTREAITLALSPKPGGEDVAAGMLGR